MFKLVKKMLKLTQKNWENTLNLAIERTSSSSFVMSMGNQVDSNEEEYQYVGFMYSKILRSIPIPTIAGNQDCDVINLTCHFNNPNQIKYDETNAGGDYYYSHGHLLVISLNSNAVLKSRKSNNVIAYEHRKCIEEAIASNLVYGYDFGTQGDRRLGAIIENNKLYGLVFAKWYDLNQNSFKVYAGITTEDVFEFVVSKTVQINHNLVNIPAKDATVTQIGNIEYLKCHDCGSLFSDETGSVLKMQ